MEQKRIIKILLLTTGALVFSWSFFFLDNFGLASVASRLKPLPKEKTLLTIDERIEKSVVKNYETRIKELENKISQLEEKVARNENNPERIIEVEEKIDINTASQKDLQKLIHIGSLRAKEIINSRPFFSLDDLLKVPGIGEKILEDIKVQGLAYVNPLTARKIQEERKEKEEKKKEKTKINLCINEIDINTASEQDLQKITGVGPVTASNIIEYRKSNRFEKIDDLIRVTGIGPATLARIKEQGCAYIKENQDVKRINENNRDICLLNSVDINTADIKSLEKITGVGPVTANNIIEHRKSNRFEKIDDLLRVTGIGPATLARIKEQGCAYVAIINNRRVSSFQSNKPQECLLNSIELNSASKEFLEQLTGVGSVIASKIIEQRNLNQFRKIDDLANVSGIGESTLNKIKNQGCAYIKETNLNSFVEVQKEIIKEENQNCLLNSIDINTADSKSLEKITGVGPVTANKIIEYRKNKLFQSLDDLNNVSGIGAITLGKIKEQGCAYVVLTDSKEIINPPLENKPIGCLPNSIDINTASFERLQEITHIGISFANQIIKLRQESLFKTLDDLSRVSGISLGGSRLQAIKNQGCAYIEKPVN